MSPRNSSPTVRIVCSNVALVDRDGHERAEHQPASHDELLDVDHFDLEARELLEQARRDATLVGADEGDEDGGIGEVGCWYVLGHRP